MMRSDDFVLAPLTRRPLVLCSLQQVMLCLYCSDPAVTSGGCCAKCIHLNNVKCCHVTSASFYNIHNSHIVLQKVTDSSDPTNGLYHHLHTREGLQDSRKSYQSESESMCSVYSLTGERRGEKDHQTANKQLNTVNI